MCCCAHKVLIPVTSTDTAQGSWTVSNSTNRALAKVSIYIRCFVRQSVCHILFIPGETFLSHRRGSQTFFTHSGGTNIFRGDSLSWSQVFPHSVSQGPIWFHMVLMFLFGPVWSLRSCMAPYGPIGSNTFPWDPVQSHTIPRILNGPTWSILSCMLQCGPVWSGVVQHGPYGPILSCVFPYGPILSRIDLHIPVLSQMVPHGPGWLHMGP